jgi:hypothetical protein
MDSVVQEVSVKQNCALKLHYHTGVKCDNEDNTLVTYSCFAITIPIKTISSISIRALDVKALYFFTGFMQCSSTCQEWNV